MREENEHKTLSKSMGIAFGYQHVKLNYHYVRIKQIEWNAIKEAKKCVFYDPALHNFSI